MISTIKFSLQSERLERRELEDVAVLLPNLRDVPTFHFALLKLCRNLLGEVIVAATARAHKVLVGCNVDALPTEEPIWLNRAQLCIGLTSYRFQTTALLPEDGFFIIKL